MTDLLSYDEDARAARIGAEILFGEMKYRWTYLTAEQAEEYLRREGTPWPIDGDELTKRGMK